MVCVERDGVFRLFRRRIRRLSATDPGGICQAIVFIKGFLSSVGDTPEKP